MHIRVGDLLMNAADDNAGLGYVWRVEEVGRNPWNLKSPELYVTARAIRPIRGVPEKHDAWIGQRRITPASWYQPFHGFVPPVQGRLF